ncbi:class I SAM-dependent methyltransferase [Leptothoe spongobia]|uniref:Class I SAM-dependent methyltransferase n=1 Tax=Leptothoe spongobia TAU-MAC 1115 TaxID=1967444 RepID=A0A947DEE5_9CYAN|nr:class I SAM-dependent methyltransferase [Leptothoe spongobia]MBT9315240.1 class I SAM-dependent methyltransferase [Leptothoe spongobia TAU-MAC 1115]
MSYSIQNANRFKWSSITGELLSERLSHLNKYIIGNTVLDVGCGGGAYVNFLAEQGLEVIGVDQYQDFLQVASEAQYQGSFVQADAAKLPFEENSFDSAYCFDVLEHVDDRKVLKEISRVTSKRIILTVPQKDEHMEQFGLSFMTYRDPTHLRYYSEDSLRELCLSIKPENIKIFPEGYLSCPWIIEYFIDNDSENIDLGSEQKSEFKKYRELAYKFVIRKLLKRISYKKIFLGLVAVIDLEGFKPIALSKIS